MAPPPPPPPPLIVAASSCQLGGSVCLFKREKIEDVDEDSVSGIFLKRQTLLRTSTWSRFKFFRQ